MKYYYIRSRNYVNPKSPSLNLKAVPLQYNSLSFKYNSDQTLSITLW